MSSHSDVIPASVRASRYDCSLIGLEVNAKADCSISGRHSCWEGGAPSPSSGCAPEARAEEGGAGHACLRKVSLGSIASVPQLFQESHQGDVTSVEGWHVL